MHNGTVRLIKACYVAEITAAFEAGESRCWQFIEGKRVCGCGKRSGAVPAVQSRLVSWGHSRIPTSSRPIPAD